MHNQISRKRQDPPQLEFADGKWLVYAVDVAGVNADTLMYENWTEYAVFEKRQDPFANEYWAECDVPEWAAHALKKIGA